MQCSGELNLKFSQNKNESNSVLQILFHTVPL